MSKKKVNISIDPTLLKRIKYEFPDINFSAFVEAAIRNHLDGIKAQFSQQEIRSIRETSKALVRLGITTSRS